MEYKEKYKGRTFIRKIYNLLIYNLVAPFLLGFLCLQLNGFRRNADLKNQQQSYQYFHCFTGNIFIALLIINIHIQYCYSGCVKYRLKDRIYRSILRFIVLRPRGHVGLVLRSIEGAWKRSIQYGNTHYTLPRYMYRLYLSRPRILRTVYTIKDELLKGFSVYIILHV